MSIHDALSSSTRREFLGAGASLTGLGVAAFTGVRAVATPRAHASSEDEAAELLDRALERVAARMPDVNVHRSNHAPMVAEALCVLGRPEAIAPWLDQYFERFERGPDARAPVDAEHWREALGDPARFSDWRALFLRELEAGDWRAVLRLWGARLVPGLAGVATHGVIRSAHAARGLGARDNTVRRGELANGLAYWAANYEELPWDQSLAPEKNVAAALARVTPRQPALAPPDGNIVTGLRALAVTPSFGPVAGLVDTSDPARTLSEMSAAFARLYLANPERRIAFTHSITAPSALRLLAPHLDDETVERATRFAWQAAAGLYVVYGDPRRATPEIGSSPDGAGAARSALIDEAVATAGAHAIKLTEACLREDALAHDPILLQAAWDAATHMTG